MAVGLQANCRKLRWQWQLIRRSLNAVVSEVRGPMTGEQWRSLSGTAGRHTQSDADRRKRHNRRSVCTVDSEERDPTAGAAGNGLSAQPAKGHRGWTGCTDGDRL